jgi:hypothetical protein
MKNVICKDRAKEICNAWHGGQWSALYQFGSSGIFIPENILKYLKEVQENREPEYNLHPGTISIKADKELKSLIRFFEFKAFEEGIKIEWVKHSQYGYLIPYIAENIYDRKITCLTLVI